MHPPKRESPPATSNADARPILDWLALPPADSPLDELEALRRHLAALRENPPPPVQLPRPLDLLHERALATAIKLIPDLCKVRLPISPPARRIARTLQDVLELLAGIYLDSAEDHGQQPIKDPRRRQELSIWRAMHALGRHLYVADLIAAPATPGIWLQLHRAIGIARRLKVDQQTPEGVDGSIMVLYQRALLLGCAQASTFTAQEWRSVDAYAAKHAPLLRFIEASSADDVQPSFWLDPAKDAGPVATAKLAGTPPSTLTRFSCAALLALLDEHLRWLGQDARPEALGLPEGLPPRLARPLLRRLKAVWGDPRKRRFPRRSQAYRARLCFGFERIREILSGRATEVAERREWMVTNESPDGYGTMHVSGKPDKVQTGDLVALRSQDTSEWQICIVRWALSENAEHLELGLQVLAPRAVPATLALPNHRQPTRHPALLMPAVPPVRPHQSLATAPGLLMEDSGKLALIVETGKPEICEVRIAGVQEQSADTDVFAIDPDRSP